MSKQNQKLGSTFRREFFKKIDFDQWKEQKLKQYPSHSSYGTKLHDFFNSIEQGSVTGTSNFLRPLIEEITSQVKLTKDLLDAFNKPYIVWKEKTREELLNEQTELLLEYEEQDNALHKQKNELLNKIIQDEQGTLCDQIPDLKPVYSYVNQLEHAANVIEKKDESQLNDKDDSDVLGKIEETLDRNKKVIEKKTIKSIKSGLLKGADVEKLSEIEQNRDFLSARYTSKFAEIKASLRAIKSLDNGKNRTQFLDAGKDFCLGEFPLPLVPQVTDTTRYSLEEKRDHKAKFANKDNLKEYRYYVSGDTAEGDVNKLSDFRQQFSPRNGKYIEGLATPADIYPTAKEAKQAFKESQQTPKEPQQASKEAQQFKEKISKKPLPALKKADKIESILKGYPKNEEGLSR